MSWNYRLVKSKCADEDLIEIMEIYYDEDNKIHSYANELLIPSGESKEDVKICLDLMYKALNKPVLNYNDVMNEIANRKHEKSIKIKSKIITSKRCSDKIE